jgi:hypothetical protein
MSGKPASCRAMNEKAPGVWQMTTKPGTGGKVRTVGLDDEAPDVVRDCAQKSGCYPECGILPPSG